MPTSSARTALQKSLLLNSLMVVLVVVVVVVVVRLKLQIPSCDLLMLDDHRSTRLHVYYADGVLQGNRRANVICLTVPPTDILLIHCIHDVRLQPRCKPTMSPRKSERAKKYREKDQGKKCMDAQKLEWQERSTPIKVNRGPKNSAQTSACEDFRSLRSCNVCQKFKKCAAGICDPPG
ncbi:hypothetical protein EYF80_022238 [Liparis tanakae]|uniref:Uncharacterized protein n=1 Tax=Liparis tanakae TaxID=230148 RepID=A0A4Z2HQJ9_9TELE|nr:hypothetical protein EYF80_022238 [Liparis tanakae]